jgi:hypothetical protein
MDEEWKSIPSLDGAKASTLGRVWLPEKTSEMPNGGVAIHKTAPRYGSVTKASATARHKYYGLVYRGKNYKVHRLVCEAFHGPAPEGRNVVIHENENALDNRPENIRWGTQKENLNAAGFIAYCKARTGENSPVIKGRKKKE